MSCIAPESLLRDALPPEIAGRVCTCLDDLEVFSVEDLYDAIANLGGNWYKTFTGITREDAKDLVDWIKNEVPEVGEVTERFYPSGTFEIQTNPQGLPIAFDGSSIVQSLQDLQLPCDLDGSWGTNRAELNSLDAQNDLQAIQKWLNARAVNANTLSQYRKESERFLLWATMERGKPLSSLTAADAALYPIWLEKLGRTEPDDWARDWKIAQNIWIGPKNAPRLSESWRPFNGPLTISSRKTALTVIRILFGFLTKTGYLKFNPFDQISSKVRYLPGEGAPKAFADRSLTERQWDEVLEHLNSMDEGEVKARLKVILSLGKGLGMRASEIIHARTGWIALRRIGDEDMTVIEIVGKGDKIRRLPLSDETLCAINEYLALRHLPDVHSAPIDTPLIANLGVGRKALGAKSDGISRSGVHKVLTDFFEAVAAKAQDRSAADAAKLRAGSAHWLRHTFATTALKAMDINVVQNAMGHASIGTTSRYLTPEETQIAQAMKKMKPI